MSPSSLSSRTQTLRVFFAFSLAFNILITPIAAIAATYKKPEVRVQKQESGARSQEPASKAAAGDVFAKPLEELAKPAAPEAVPAPAPLPAAPPVGTVTSSLTASLAAVNGGVDADSDGKADPGDTIAYTLSLANSSGAGATGLAIANPLDSHTTIVGGTLNSTPVAFDQSVSLNEDATLVITLTGQDPDGTVTPNFSFKKSDGTAFPLNPTTIATAHGTIGNFGSVSCDANGVCSQQVTYTPAPNYNGLDSFNFKANDNTANSNENGLVSITVNAVNDAPTFTVPSNPAAVNEDAGVTTVTNYVSGIRPAQSGNSTEDTQTVSFAVTNVTHSALFTAGGQPTLTVSNSGNQPFPLTANLTYTPAPNANGTSVVTYHLHDNGGTANSGVDNSADQTFTITVNAVNDAPVVDPVAKAFTVQANMRSVGFTGLLANATDPDATNANGDALSADAAAGYTSPTFTLASLTGTCTSIVANPATGAGPCTIAITSTSSGTFTFDPPPGVTGAVTLNYTISDNGNPGSATSLAGTINITVNGPVIWFVDPNRTNNGNGTLSGAADAAGTPGPFKTLAAANNAINLKTGQRVFVYTGTTPAGEALDLSGNNNWLVGQGTVAANFDTFFGLTGGNAPPAATVGRPTLNSTPATAFAARPQISGTVTMRNNTQVTGVKIVTTGATAGLRSVGFSSGTSLVKDVSVTTATGNAVDFSGTQTITYETSDGTNSPNVLVAVGGIALTVSGTVTIGANGFTFRSISANGGTNGIVLNNTGATAGLTVTGTGTTAGSGGTITNCTQKGADFRTAKNISLSNMNFTNNATANLGASGTCGDALNGTNGPTTCNANIAMSSVTTATLTNVTATGSKQIGIDVKGGSDLTLTNVTATGNGNETMEDGVQITDLTGTLTVAGGLFRDNAANQFEVQNGVAGPLSVIVGTSTFSNTAFPTGATTPANTTSNSGLFLATHSSAVMNPTITNNTVDRIYAQGIRLDMAGASSMTANIGPASGAGNGNNITNSNQAISVTGSNTGGLTYKIRNNTANIVPANVAGGTTNQIGVSRSTTSGTWNGLIENNTVGTVGTANSGCQIAGCDGIDIVNNSAGTYKLSILSNTIRQTEGSGMVIIAGGAPDNSNVSWIVKNNTISNPDQNAGQANPAILIQSGTSAGTDTSKTCLEISGNTISGTWSLGTGHLSSIRVRSLTTAAGSFAIVGFNPATEYPNDATGVSGSTTGVVGNVGNVADYIRQQNPGVTNASPGQNAASATQGAAVFSNSGGCPLLLAEGGVMAALNAPSLISTVFFSSFEMATADSTAPSPITTANAISASLTQPQLDTLVDAAIQRWTAAGLSAEQIASLREIKFEVTDLTNAYLAESFGNRILVDRGAEGKGWFLDSTPQDDSEFGNVLAATRRYTDPQSAPAGHIDLLTAIGHEMGHKLGLGDSYLERDRNDLMYGYLTVGERRLPEKGQAAHATAGGSAKSHFLALEPTRMAIAFGEVLAGAVGARAEVLDKAEALVDAEASVGGESAASNKEASQISQSVLNVARASSGMSGLRNHAGRNKAVSGNTAARGLSAATASAVPPTPVGSFPINGTGAGQGFQLPDGKTITITFKATLNAPPNFASYSATQKVSAQATLTGSFVGNPLLSDDPSVVGATDPTSTNVDLYDSTVGLTSSNNPSNVSQTVTFTATIGTSGTPNGSATTRTGTVTFKDGGSPITCENPGGQTVNGSNVATCQISTLSNTSHTITADYSGDGNFDPSSGSLTGNPQVVNKSGTNATLTSSLNPSTVTQNVTFTLTISSATSVPGPPTGTVTFKDGVNPIGCSNAGGQLLNGSGVATCQISTLSATSHTITADYPGDANFNANNGIALTGNPQVVNKATPTVTLVSSTNPSFVSQNVTFTATVTAPGGISATPSGTLTFKDGGVAMTCTGGSQLLSGGVATCQKNNLTAGSHTITVDYPTDANFNAVSGTAMTAAAGQNGNPQVVNQSNTTMTVSSSLNPSKVTESVTFTLQIKSANLATVPGPPTGQVKFWDGPANTGTQIGGIKTLNNVGCVPDANSACVVSDATTLLTAGTHTITVEYLGDSDKFTANAQTLSGGQVVNKSDTTTTITSDLPDPSNVAQSVNIVAHVVSTGVTFTNTGTVLFKEGSNTIAGCAAQAINGSGDATCTTSALPAGTLSLTAVYSGDATFNTSTSTAEPHQVGPTCSNSIVVTDQGDSGANTLRQAMLDICDGGTITFAPAVTNIAITTGELHFTTKNMTITGPGSGILAINAGTLSRVFNVDSGRTIVISGMTLNNGKATGANGGGGGAGSPALGGGVANAGTLTLTGVTVNNSQAKGGDGGPGGVGGPGGGAFGGNIFNSGTLALNNCIINAGSAIGGVGGNGTTTNGNGGSGFGGGIYNTGGLTVTNTTVSSNNSNGGAAGSGSGAAGVAGNGLGGGIYNDATASAATVTISNSTINGNGASTNGGGIANVGLASFATLTITNSTISGNTANNDGGGLYNDSASGTTTITASTVTDNHADNDSSLVGTGGGIRVVSGPVILQDTIVANNFVASLQVETATVTGGPITPGVAQVETLTVVVTSPPITTSGTGTLKVTIGGPTLADKSIPLVNGDTAASIAIKIRDLLNADATVHGPFTATVGTGADTDKVILTRNSPAANDGTLNLAIVGCGTAPCTGLNSAPTSANTTAGVAGSAGTKQVETATVVGTITGINQVETATVTTNGGANGAMTVGGTFNVTVTAAGMNNSPKDVPVTVGAVDESGVAAAIRAALTADADVGDVTTGFFTVSGSGASVVLTAKAKAANDTTMNIAIGACAACTTLDTSATSANTTAGVAAGINQVETATVTTNVGANGAMTAGGTFNVTVTAVGMNGSPKDVPVTVGAVDESGVATAIRAALAADPDVGDVTTGFFTVSGAGASVVLTAKAKAANDTTMNIAIGVCAACTTLDTSATSANTTAGDARGSANATVTVTAAGMNNSPKTLNVLVLADDDASAVAGKIRAALSADPDITHVVTGFTVSGATDKIILTKNTAAANDTSLNIATDNGTSAGLTPQPTSGNTTAGVAPIVAVNQVETATVSITSSPISTNGTGIVRVTFNSTTLPDYNVPLLAGDDEAAVAIKIRNILNADGAFNGTYTASVGIGADTNKVILTKNSPAGNDTSLNLEIVGCGSSCPGLNSVTTSANTTTGVAPGTGTAKVTITANASYFYAAGSGTKDIFVPVLASDTAAQVAAKIRDFLNTSDTDVNSVFMASAENEKVRLTRKVVAPDDPLLTIAIGNGTSTGLTPSPASENTRLGGGSVIRDDINGAVDSTSSYNLVGVDTGITAGISSVDGRHNQVGTVGVPIDPKLDPLANNGGPTRTHKLQDPSTAIDKGNNFGALPADQRGLQRTVDQPGVVNEGDGTDIGAFEKQTPTAAPTIILTSANGGGPPYTTRDSTPDFSIGNLTVGGTVELLRGGTQVATVVATSTTMSLTDNTLTTDGTYVYSARQTVNGDPATSGTIDVTVDTRPTVTALLSADDTGASSSDKITKNTTPRFTGTADPNTSVQLFASLNAGPYVQVGTGTSGAGGAWTIMSSVLADGPYSITAKEVIGGFTGAASTPLTGVVIDTSVAPPSTPVLLPANDSGTLGDTVTSNTTPAFTGTAEANSAIQLFANGNPVGAGSANGSGNWSVAPTSALSDGTYLMTAVATDLAGNVSAPSGGSSVTIDTQVAAPSMPDLITADDSGAFNNDNYTNKTTPTFTGTAEAGSDVKLFAGAVQVGSGTATGGNWSIPIPLINALTDGTYQITVTATDPAGNVSAASTALSVTIDTVVPPKPSTPDLVAGDDTGILNTDNITKTTTPTFTGTAEASARIDLFKNSGGGPTLAGTGNADGLGNWNVLSGALADGTYQMTVVATDLAGNQSVSSDSLSITIDTVPPPAPLALALLPADDTGSSSSDGITKKNTPTFTGTAELNSIVQLFAGATPVGSGTAAGGNFSIVSGLLPDNSYSMTAQATDLAGNTGVASAPPVPITIDTVKPTVSMASAAGNPTSTALIPVTVQFNETVFGFTSGDIVPSNGTVSNFAGSNANYSFDLTATAAGGVSADIAADAATDTAGNGNTAAVQFNRTYDPSALSATITAISPNPRNTAVSSIQIVFNKPVTGFDLSDLTLKLNNGLNLLTGAQTLSSGDNINWTLGNLSGITAAQGTYDLKLTAAGSGIQDSTSTALASDATASWVMDTTPPTVTVEQAIGQSDPVNGPSGTTTINFTATFSEAVTGLTAAGITIFGTANPTIVNVSGSGTTYNLAVQGMSQTGTVRASVNASAATDSAGNGNSASTSADNTVQFNKDNFSTLEVNTTADTDDGSCDPLGTGSGNKDCTLREAINAANGDFGAETITFNSTVFAAPGPYTINLTGALPNLSSDMTISGPGAKVLTVKRNTGGNYSIFTIVAGNNNVTIDQLTISNGSAVGSGGGIFNSSSGTVNITNSTISGNSAGSDGGGIQHNSATGTLNVTGSTISGNTAQTGGGISLTGGTAVNVTNSTISGNTATLDGGGISNAVAPLTISNSTITNNRADNDNNGSGTGGGIFRGSGTVTLQNTIVAGNFNDASPSTTADDISGTMDASSSFNLIGTGGSGGLIDLSTDPTPAHQNQVGVANAGLNPLGDSGGPTMTHSLQCTSPAIDKGFKFTTTTDQRGGTRPFDFADAVYPNAVGGDGSDIGAVETQSAGGCVPTAVPTSTSTSEDTPKLITLTGTYSQNIPLTFSITQNPGIGQLSAISNTQCTFNLSMTCTADVTYTPNANANGADLFKFKVSAGGLDSDPADVNVTVNAANDPPTFLQAGNQTVPEDAGPQSVPNFITTFSPGPPDESGQSVQFIITFNTNAGLFATPPLIDASGTLTYAAGANANGSATITVVAQDNGGGTNTSPPQSFTITVLSVNDAPSFTVGPDQTVLEDAGQQVVNNFATNISVGPAQESAQTAQFVITNNTNPGMFVEGPVISPTGKLTYISAPDANGTATITLVLKDNGGTANGGQDTSAPQTFTINVTSVNDQPTLNPVSNLTIDEDAATQTVNLSGIGAGGGETQLLGLTATSNNPSLIPNPIAISYTSPNATGSISFKPAPDQNGFATITLTLKDDGGTSNGGVDTVVRTFVVQVNPVNDAPINIVPGPQTVVENTNLVFALSNGNQIVVTDVDAAGSQVKVTLNATNGVITLPNASNLAFIVGDGTADPTMTFVGSLTNINAAIQGLIFAPPNGFSGAASLQIITNDQGDHGSGGALTDTDTISITVSDGGTLQFSAATYSVSENNGPAVVTITRTGGSAGTATVQIASSDVTATAGSDYTAVSQTVTFGIGETSKTVNIPITNEFINEPDETVNLTLSNVGGSGALGAPATAVLTIANDDPTGGYIKFSAPSYSVAEGGIATITVQRVGTLTQAVSVDFATTDNSDPAAQLPCAPTPGNTLATSRCDFTSTFGRLSWAAGDGADKTFKVLTTQDNFVEGPETLTLTLSGLSPSASFSGPSTETLTITDDLVEPSGNPIDDSDVYVEQLYRDFLNRQSDPSGKAFWVNNINHCNDPAQRPPGQTAAQCIQIARIVTAGAFFLSIEFQATGGTAYLTNKASFGSLPNFVRFERDAQQIGQGYVFGAPGAEALLEANKVAYYNDYVTRTEFVNTYGGLSNQQYVDTLISNTGVSFTQGERTQLVNGLNNQTETRATVLRKITEKPAFRTAEFNSMFVLMEYFGFLRRNPDQAGFAFWLNKLNQANGDYFAAEMVKAFIESSEYRQRFGQ